MREYFDIENLRIAWERCVRDRNKETKDYAGIDLFQTDLDKNIKNLSDLLLSQEYVPSIPAKFYEPKSSRTQRTKTILAIEDAIVYQCIIDSIARISFDAIKLYDKFVFGSVLHEEAKLGTDLLKKENPTFYFFELWMENWNQFANSVNNEIDDRAITFKLETDITGFFDCIPHSKLLLQLHQKYNIPQEVLELLSECLNTWSGTSVSSTPGVGIPQGPQPSFFLANLYLIELDEILVTKGLSYYRYMDDIRIFSSDEDELWNTMVLIDNHLKSKGLCINSHKTLTERIGNDREDAKIDVSGILAYLNSEEQDTFHSQDYKVIDKFEMLDQFGSGTDQRYNLEFGSDPKSQEETKVFIATELVRIDEIIQSEISFDNGISFKNAKGGPLARTFVNKWLKLGFDYRNVLNVSKAASIGFEPNNDYIDLWLFLSEKIFWKSNQFCWILNRYEPTDNLKSKLTKIITEKEVYEWMQYHYILTLAISQKLTVEELRSCFQKLKLSNSYFVKLAYYRLLILQIDNSHQLYATINNSIRAEQSLFLKNTLLYDLNKKNSDNLSKYDIAISIGLL